MSYFRSVNPLIALCCFFFAASTTTSCAPRRKAAYDHPYVERVKLLQDGETAREEIIDYFGAPDSSYENGRIIIFYWGKDPTDPHNSLDMTYHLVLVFSEENVLERHSLVRVR